MRALLISTYDLGRQPFGLASPAAWLREAGVDVTCVDVSRGPLDDGMFGSFEVAGVYLPMHTATRLALPLLARARRAYPGLRLCAFGLYAPLNERLLREAGVDAVFGGEFEEELTDWIVHAGRQHATSAHIDIRRIQFKVPDRSGLPPLDRYAALQLPDGTRRIAGYTEASRGCKHLCRHCPVVPIYRGRFRVVSPQVVIEDIGAQVAAGARHITFGDPDFFNGIGHARAVVEAFAREWPGLTYDVTIKIEHLLKHRDGLELLARTGCLFITSAVESVDDAVLEKLQKGHTRRDFETAVSLCREAGVALVPTFIPFTPWTTRESYIQMLSAIASLELVDHVPPIQLAIRLLIPNGSRLLELDDVRHKVGRFDPVSLAYPWIHDDPAVDALQKNVEALVATTSHSSRVAVFARAWDLAHRAAGGSDSYPMLRSRAAIPFLTEPWYC